MVHSTARLAISRRGTCCLPSCQSEGHYGQEVAWHGDHGREWTKHHAPAIIGLHAMLQVVTDAVMMASQHACGLVVCSMDQEDLSAAKHGDV